MTSDPSLTDLRPDWVVRRQCPSTTSPALTRRTLRVNHAPTVAPAIGRRMPGRNGRKSRCLLSFAGYLACMSTEESKRRPLDQHDLWSEALWGLGLIGAVLILVTFIAVTFGR